MNSLARLVDCLRLLHNKHREGLPVHQALLFLRVAQRGTATYAQLSADLGVSGASISRSCTALSSVCSRSPDGKGMGLLQIERDPNHEQRLLVTLSKKGESLRDQLRLLME